jgi:hypothetical protein
VRGRVVGCVLRSLLVSVCTHVDPVAAYERRDCNFTKQFKYGGVLLITHTHARAL